MSNNTPDYEDNLAFEPQNTKNEQLTEQWKKSKLPSGWYWVEGCRNKEIYAYTGEYLNHMYRPQNSDRIIEQVPSYEEWEKLNWYAGNGVEENQELKMENAQLKELLEECSPYIGHSAASRMIKNSAGHKKDMKLLTKIDEALK